MSLKWHPDRNKAPEARDKFEQIKAASLILLSEADRKNYDRYLKAKQEAQERIERAGADRKKIIDELLQREKEYQDSLRRHMSQSRAESTASSEYMGPEDEGFRKAESELERLIREIKIQEFDERKEEKQKKRKDHISQHYDMTTIKIKMKPQQQVLDFAMNEQLIRNLLKQYGTIDGVLIDKNGLKAFAMFKYRDSAHKAMSAKSENEALHGYHIKLYSTSKAMEREERKKKRHLIQDPIEKMKAKILIDQGTYSNITGQKLGKTFLQKSLEELEEEVFQKIRVRKERRLNQQQVAQ
eukprot:403347433